MVLCLLSLTTLSAWDALHQNVLEQFQTPPPNKSPFPPPSSVLSHEFRLGFFLTVLAITYWALVSFPWLVQFSSTHLLPCIVKNSLGSFYPSLLLCAPIATLFISTIVLCGSKAIFYKCLTDHYNSWNPCGYFANSLLILTALPTHEQIINESPVETFPIKVLYLDSPLLFWETQALYTGLAQTLLKWAIIIYSIWTWWGVSWTVPLIYVTLTLVRWTCQLLAFSKISVKKIAPHIEPRHHMCRTLLHTLFSVLALAEYACFLRYPTPTTLSPAAVLTVQTWFTVEMIIQTATAAFFAVQYIIKRNS